ncbi:hypothetical protein ACLMJK_003266 [Lecanora helva]
MAPRRVLLDPVETPGICHAPNLTNESADMASRILQANRANHIFTTWEKEMGSNRLSKASLHNHIVYHTLSLYALGASPEMILHQTKRNTTYQLVPPKFPDEATLRAMTEPEKLKTFIGKEEHFLDFCEFFEQEIERYGYEDVLQKYLVGDNEIARDIFPRIYHGYVHGIMHIGLGLEFKQAPILAEGLAEAAVHHDWWYTAYIDACAAKAHDPNTKKTSLIECFEKALLDEKITTCSSYDYMKQYEAPSEEFPDGRWFVRREPYRDGVVGLVKDELSTCAAGWQVRPEDDLELATAELINISIYIAAAAQRPPHEPRYDFFLIHGSNACLWHSVYLAEASMSRSQKAKLIETTGHMLLFLWAGVGSPPPQIDWLLTHPRKQPNCGWEGIYERANKHEDDGHMIKLIRALKNGEDVCKPYEGREEFKMKQDWFLQAAHAAMDSSSEQPMRYVQHFDIIRLVGFQEAWEKVPIDAREEVPVEARGKVPMGAQDTARTRPMEVDVTG